MTGVVWIIVMFLSDSHSDGTHSLQRIIETDAILFLQTDEEQTGTWMSWGWAHFSKFSFLGELFFKLF